MEFGNIGQHCAFSMCGQQDFLPFECDGCKHIYCTQHSRADDHECKLPSDYDSVYVIICPICEQRIKMKAKEDPNNVWSIHSTSGQCIPKQGQSSKPIKKCMANKCYARLTPINSVTCSQCCKEVCLKHRFEDNHQCTKVVRNQQTAKSKLLQPGFLQSQTQTQTQQPVINQQDFQSLQSNINKFSVSQQRQEKPSIDKYQPESCEVCGQLFRDINELIKHTEGHFQDFNRPKAVETEKCPHCPKRFALTEIVSHLQQDHFIF